MPKRKKKMKMWDEEQRKEIEKILGKPRFSSRTETEDFRCCWCGFVFQNFRSVWQLMDDDKEKMVRLLKRSIFVRMPRTIKEEGKPPKIMEEQVICGGCCSIFHIIPTGFAWSGYTVGDVYVPSKEEARKLPSVNPRGGD
jgi:hypothetical protein